MFHQKNQRKNKFSITLIIGMVIFCLYLPPSALADTLKDIANNPSQPGVDVNKDFDNPPAKSKNQDGATNPDELFYNFKYGNNSSDTTKIAAVNRIVSSKSWQTVVADIVKILLNISGALTLLAMTISGVLMVTARGNPEEFEKGKKLAIGAVAGLIIIAVSYAVVIGVSELQFFTN